jgi:hypothetical protein
MNFSYRSPSITPFDPPKETEKKPKKWVFKAWRPKSSFTLLLLIIGSLGILFFVLGIIILSWSADMLTYEARYDSLCELNSNCTLPYFEITKPVSKPTYLQYRVQEFYQNHLKYTRSIQLGQLRDGRIYKADELQDCSPYLTNREMSKTRSVLNTTLDPDAPAFPCGLASYTFFNDTFELVNLNSAQSIRISSQNISWSSDREYKFKNTDLGKQWLDIEDERFINWIKVSPFENFIKTWGVINEDLPIGRYQFRVSNTWNSAIFGGRKSIILREANFFGGSNNFLGGIFVTVGFLGISAVIFLLIWKVKNRRKFENL